MLRELKHAPEAFFAEQGEFDNEVDRAVITVAGVLQRRAAHGDARRRADRRARRPAHHQRADRGVAGLRSRQAATRASSRSTTSAAARSTSRSSRVEDGVFQVLLDQRRHAPRRRRHRQPVDRSGCWADTGPPSTATYSRVARPRYRCPTCTAHPEGRPACGHVSEAVQDPQGGDQAKIDLLRPRRDRRLNGKRLHARRRSKR